jgi:hypothetical protein
MVGMFLRVLVEGDWHFDWRGLLVFFSSSSWLRSSSLLTSSGEVSWKR